MFVIIYSKLDAFFWLGFIHGNGIEFLSNTDDRQITNNFWFVEFN